MRNCSSFSNTSLLNLYLPLSHPTEHFLIQPHALNFVHGELFAFATKLFFDTDFIVCV